MQVSARATVALAVAYAVALQAVLLAFGMPASGSPGLAVLPICAHVGGARSAPTGDHHDHDGGRVTCCIAGCCCGAPADAAAGPMLSYAPPPRQILAAPLKAALRLRLSVTGAHRSRAPPSAQA